MRISKKRKRVMSFCVGQYLDAFLFVEHRWIIKSNPMNAEMFSYVCNQIGRDELAVRREWVAAHRHERDFSDPSLATRCDLCGETTMSWGPCERRKKMAWRPSPSTFNPLVVARLNAALRHLCDALGRQVIEVRDMLG